MVYIIILWYSRSLYLFLGLKRLAISLNITYKIAHLLVWTTNFECMLDGGRKEWSAHSEC